MAGPNFADGREPVIGGEKKSNLSFLDGGKKADKKEEDRGLNQTVGEFLLEDLPDLARSVIKPRVEALGEIGQTVLSTRVGGSKNAAEIINEIADTDLDEGGTDTSRKLNIGVGEFNRGVEDVAQVGAATRGALNLDPVSVIAAGPIAGPLLTIPSAIDSLFGTDLKGAATSFLDDLGEVLAPTVEDQTTGERIFGRTARELGRTAVVAPAGPATGAAARSAEKVLRGVSSGATGPTPTFITPSSPGASLTRTEFVKTGERQGALANRLVQETGALFNRAPAASTAIEAGLGASAGTGAGIASEIVGPDASQTAKETGEIVGLLAGATSPVGAALLGRAGLNSLSRKVGLRTKAQAEEDARTVIRKSTARPEKLDNFLDVRLEDVTTLDGKTLPYRTNQLIDDKGLSAAEDIIAKRTESFGNRERQQETLERIIQDTFEEAAPTFPKEIDGIALQNIIRDEVNRFNDNLTNIATKLDEDVVKALDDIGVENLRPDKAQRRADDISIAIIQKLDEANKVALKPIKDKYAKLNNGVFVTDLPLRRAIKRLVKNWRQEGVIPANMPDANLLSNLMKAGTKRFKFLSGLRSQAGDLAVAAASGDKPNKNLARRYSQLIKAIDEKGLDSMLSNEYSASVRQTYLEAKTMFKIYAETFRERIPAKLLGHGDFMISLSDDMAQRFNVAPTKAAAMFMAGRESAEDFIRVFGNNKDAETALLHFNANSMFNDLADVNGKLKASMINKWINRRASALNEFPNVLNKLRNVQTAQKAVDEIVGKQKRSQREVDRSILRFALDGRDPKALINGILSHQDPGLAEQAVRELFSRVPGLNNKNAKQALKALFYEVMGERITTKAGVSHPILFPDKAALFLNGQGGKGRRVMKALGFSQEHINRVDTTFKAAAAAMREKLTGKPQVSLSSDSSILPFGLPALLSRLYGIERGVVGVRFVVSEFATRTLNRYFQGLTRQQSLAILEEALADPAMMQQLFNKVSPKSLPGMLKKYNLFLANVGLPTQSGFDPSRLEQEESEK